MLTSEMNLIPMQDFSFSGVGSYGTGKFLELGAGFCLNRLFSANSEFTTPTNTSTSNLISQDTTYDTLRDASGNFITDPLDPMKLMVDTAYLNRMYYTFKSTKAMFRGCIDPKVLFPSDIFGPEDLKIYGEVAVLGFQNYKRFYEDIKQRMPLMFGFNVPTFKMMDLLALEMEIFDNPYVPSWDNPVRNGVPHPVSELVEHPDKIKWSVYAKKDFGQVKIVGQIARDHLIPNVNGPMSQVERTDVLRKSNNWYWLLRIGYGF